VGVAASSERGDGGDGGGGCCVGCVVTPGGGECAVGDVGKCVSGVSGGASGFGGGGDGVVVGGFEGVVALEGLGREVGAVDWVYVDRDRRGDGVFGDEEWMSSTLKNVNQNKQGYYEKMGRRQ